MILAAIELARRKTLEVGALAAVDVDDLDIVAGLDEIGLRGRRLDALVEHRIGERVGQLEFRTDLIAARRSILSVSGVVVSCASSDIGPPGAATISEPPTLDGEAFRRAGRRRPAEEANSLSAGEVDAAPLDLRAELSEALLARKKQRLQPGSIAVARRAEHRRIGAAVLVQRHKFAGLPTFGIGDRHFVAGLDLDQQRAAAGNRVALGSRRQRKSARPYDRTRARRAGDHVWIAKGGHQPFLPARADLLQRKIILTGRISEGRQGGKASQLRDRPSCLSNQRARD